MAESIRFPALPKFRFALFVSALMFILPASAMAQEPMQALLQRLASQGQVEIATATVYDLPVTQEFYSKLEFQPAWNRQAAVAELSEAISQAWREGMNPADYHQPQVQGILDGSLELDPAPRDLLLTDSLVRLTYHYAFGKVDPNDFPDSWNFNRRLPEVNPADWAVEIIARGDISKGFDALKPANLIYPHLVQALAEYRALAARGGWNAIDDGPALRVGDYGPRVAQLRLRLEAEDYSGLASSDPQRFDSALAAAVARFQRRHHLDDDGIVGKQTLAAMNIPVEQRVDQIRVNLERARILQDIPETAVVVDIAGFEVSFYRNGKRLLQSRAQVGKPYRSTPVFRDSIRYIDFNPTWTVPPSILKQDVLPAIKRDPGYLAKRHMQVLTMQGAVVDPATVNWQLYPQRSFPYMLRQQPGPDNALGRLKIMFPNEYMIYLHDTPSRDLFRRSERTFSSGCIRVEDIEELAQLLLNEPKWNRAAIDEVIGSRKTKRVNLPEPVPVYLAYWTVHVTEDGAVHFKRDPYGRDPKAIKTLDKPLKPDPAVLEKHRRG